MHNSTLCYIVKDGKVLMLHRVKKKNDINHDKWIGIGGKFEPEEAPEECILRETKEETGLTVHQYLNRQRVGRAKQLLLSTALPVSKIAEQTGFSGSSHLAAVFKAMTGQAPRDYRRRL